ncbi:MAG: hypothetical protein ONB11_03840, partial [candidate division KSB1 bacterium]|nr:hypothetical protein [candidate division KSB1 bacterium]
MKTNRILLLLTAVVVLLTMTGYSLAQQINFNLIGAGARARGMGGAFIGVADDATAVSWNPAGLVRLEKPEASVVGLFESFNVTTDIPNADTDPYKSSHFNLNFLSAAYPLSIGEKNLVAAVALQQVVDLYYKYDDDEYKAERTGGINTITPAFGIQLSPNISLGAAINIYTGNSKFNYEDKTGFYMSQEEKYTYSGTNFNIGGLFDFNKFRFGAVFKTPFELQEEGKDNGVDVIIHMPQMIGLGAAYQATDKLTVAADFEMRKYSDSEIEDNATGEKEKAGFEDINQFRLGAEYLIMSGNSILPVRLGLATTPTLFK